MDPSYNASFDSFGSGGQTISSGDGGVVLGGNQKTKGGKKAWIIGVIVIALMLVGALAFILMPKNGGKTAILKQALNEYSNYLLYGEESDKEITETNWSFAYYYDKMLYEDYDEAYFENLVGKFDAFVKAFQEDYKEDNFEDKDEYEYITSLVEDNKKALDSSKELKAGVFDKQQVEKIAKKTVDNSSLIYGIVSIFGDNDEK